MAKTDNLQPYKKRTDYTVNIARVLPGTQCYNKLEDAHYTATEEKRFMITGTRGEQWMTSEDKIKKTYDLDLATLKKLDNGEHIAGDFSPKPDASIVWMRKADAYEKVETSWGEVLSANRPGIEHGAGDMVVYYSDENGKPNPDDRAIVNGAVFQDTYEPAESVKDIDDQKIGDFVVDGEEQTLSCDELFNAIASGSEIKVVGDANDSIDLSIDRSDDIIK